MYGKTHNKCLFARYKVITSYCRCLFITSGVMALTFSVCYVFKDTSPDTGSISAMNPSVLLPGEILACEVFWTDLLLEKKLEKCPEDQVRGLIGI